MHSDSNSKYVDIVDIKDVELTLLPSYLQDGVSNLMAEVENQRTGAPNELVELLNPSKSSQHGSISNQKNVQPPQRPPRNHGQHGKISAEFKPGVPFKESIMCFLLHET